MDLPEFLVSRIRIRLDGLFAAARRLPADRLDWRPGPRSRSALDQLQEVATVVDAFWDAHAARRIEFDEAKMAAWTAARERLTDLDALERHAKASYERLYAFIAAVEPEEWRDKVEMPFPGEFDLAYILNYYAWNAAYHEGQINLIATLLPEE